MSVSPASRVARIVRGRTATVRWTVVIALLAVVTLESRMRPVEYWRCQSACCLRLARVAAAGGHCPSTRSGNWRAASVRKMRPTCTTRHSTGSRWSTAIPASCLRRTSSSSSISAGFPTTSRLVLRQRGVTLLLVHSAFYIKGDFTADVRALKARPDLEWAGMFRWNSGDTSEVFRLK